MLPLSLLARRLPSRCLLCDVALTGAQPLCGPCEADLPWLDAACPHCAEPTPAGTPCAACCQSPPPYAVAACAFCYAAPVSSWLNRYKHHGQLAAGHWLARLLAVRLAQQYAARGLPLPDLLVPVPLHVSRLRRRGFDQGREITRVLSRQLGIPWRDAVQRQRPTPSQQRLSRADRQRNLAGAFALLTPLDGQRVAVVDDVLTTGSTAAELARLLLAGGAGAVHAWAIARTP